MLKKISPLISSELLKILDEMGHGDEIVFADANFPSASRAAKHIIPANGIGIDVLLDAVLDLFPVDTFVEKPIKLMQVVPGDDYKPVIWDAYKKILAKYGITEDKIDYLDRFDYYNQADRAYCVVSTGERALYANVIVKKGVILLNH